MLALATAVPKLTSLGGHSVYVLLLQLALLMVVARLGGELAKRISLPSVVGELAAGILLGPTLFGHFAPDAYATLFPPASFHYLEVVSTLGMVLLLMLTGLETDVRLLRNLGRPALLASAFGMVLPFVMGLGLGFLMPDRFVHQADHRTLFAFFVATAMSISAMPVIAKILMDLDLTRRNIGLVILSAGVVDDTTGWLILSVIAGVASTGSADIGKLAVTLGWTVGFVVGAAVVLYPVLRGLFKVAIDHFKSKDADLVLMVVVTLLGAAATERIGVHAVFGAFIVGVVMRQVPRLRHDTVHKLESVTMNVLAPVFFGVVGLKVNLLALGGGGWVLIVLGVATISKLVGATAGARWGGLGWWESTSIAVAMNARGAMELVVASIGLSLGILNQSMFSIIVVVAIATSFMAPLALRFTMSRVSLTEDERERIAEEQAREFFDAKKLRTLIPTAGGPFAVLAAQMAYTLGKGSDSPVGVLYVDSISSWWERMVARFRPKLAGRGIDEHFAALRKLAGTGPAPTFQTVASRDIAPAIVAEASKGYHLIMLGASRFAGGVAGLMLEELVEQAPCHLAVLKPVGQPSGEFKRLLVPVDGSVFTRAAVEFAVLYAERAGAEITLLFLSERRPHAVAYADEAQSLAGDSTGAIPRMTAEGEPATGPISASASDGLEDDETASLEARLTRISPVFKASRLRPTLLSRSYDPVRSAVAAEAATGKYDLIVLGTENRAIRNRLFFGYENERLLRESPVSLMLVVPKIGGGTAA